MQQVCARVMHMWGALAIFSLTVILFLLPWFPTTCKTHTDEQGEKQKQAKRSVKTPRRQEHSLPRNSGEIHNLSWPLEVFRLEWNAKAERTLQSFTAAWLQLLLCTFLSGVSHLTLPYTSLQKHNISSSGTAENASGSKSYIATSSHTTNNILFITRTQIHY